MSITNTKYLRQELIIAWMISWPIIMIPAIIFGGMQRPLTDWRALTYIAFIFGVYCLIFVAPFFSATWRSLILKPGVGISEAKFTLAALSATTGAISLHAIFNAV